MGDRTLDYIALCVLIFVVVTIIYGVIFIHDIPYEIAKKRKHPHQDAIHTAGWVSLFLMHTIWPFLWIWATLYKPGLGWGFTSGEEGGKGTAGSEETTEIVQRLEVLEKKIVQRERSYKKDIKALHNSVSALKEKIGNKEA